MSNVLSTKDSVWQIVNTQEMLIMMNVLFLLSFCVVAYV